MPERYIVTGEPENPKRELDDLSSVLYIEKFYRNMELARYAEQEPNWPEGLRTGVNLAKRELAKLHRELGLDIKPEDIAEPAFLTPEGANKYAENPLGFSLVTTSKDGDIRVDGGGFATGILDRPVVLISPQDSALSLAATAYHEMLHRMGTVYTARITKNGERVRDIMPRQGLLTIVSNSQRNEENKAEKGPSTFENWIFEEGIVSYLEAEFIENNGDEINSEEMTLKETLLRDFPKIGENHVVNKFGLKIDKRLFNLNYDEHGNPKLHAGGSARAAMLIETLMRPMETTERELFKNTLLKARFEPTLIKDAAQQLDSVWGKGTYARLMHIKNYDVDGGAELRDAVQEYGERAKTRENHTLE